MLRLFVFVCSCAVWLTLGAAPATAQVGDCQRTTQWTIDRVGKDHVKLVGQVEIDCGDQSFAADEVELFTDTHRLIATGNVVFTSGNNRIAADRLDYNTETRTGIFHNATGTAVLKDKSGPPQERSMFGTSEPDVYFYGKTLEKVGREKYKISGGGFTTCVQPTPRWQLTAGTVLLNLEKHAILTNSLFKVKGVPVLYLPIFYYPVDKDDRSTGFLIPTYGTSTIRGHTISNAFFWAISRSQDATFLHDWYSTTGQGDGRRIPVSGRAGIRRADPFLQPAGARGESTPTSPVRLSRRRNAAVTRSEARCRSGSASGSGRAGGPITSRTSPFSRPTTRTSTTRRGDRASTAARSPAPWGRGT